jgi:hypothetical protein
MEGYIKFICHFGPALTGMMACWSNKKTTKQLSDLPTITDKAFIYLCIINYRATWKAQEQKKSEETNIQVLHQERNHFRMSLLKLIICFFWRVVTIMYAC